MKKKEPFEQPDATKFRLPITTVITTSDVAVGVALEIGSVIPNIGWVINSTLLPKPVLAVADLVRPDEVRAQAGGGVEELLRHEVAWGGAEAAEEEAAADLPLLERQEGALLQRWWPRHHDDIST